MEQRKKGWNRGIEQETIALCNPFVRFAIVRFSLKLVHNLALLFRSLKLVF